MDQDHYLYILAKEENGRALGPVKIGITKSLSARLATLQTACPFPIRLVHAITFPSRWMALQMEGAFHATQRERRLKGEWFDMDPADALMIVLVHFRWALSIEGVPDDLQERVLELSGAGAAGQAILEGLRAGSLQ